MEGLEILNNRELTLSRFRTETVYTFFSCAPHASYACYVALSLTGASLIITAFATAPSDNLTELLLVFSGVATICLAAVCVPFVLASNSLYLLAGCATKEDRVLGKFIFAPCLYPLALISCMISLVKSSRNQDIIISPNSVESSISEISAVADRNTKSNQEHDTDAYKLKAMLSVEIDKLHLYLNDTEKLEPVIKLTLVNEKFDNKLVINKLNSIIPDINVQEKGEILAELKSIHSYYKVGPNGLKLNDHYLNNSAFKDAFELALIKVILSKSQDNKPEIKESSNNQPSEINKTDTQVQFTNGPYVFRLNDGSVEHHKSV